MNILAQVTTTAEGGATEVLANLSVSMIGLIALVLTLLRFALLHPVTKNPKSPARGFAEVAESLLIALVLVFLLIRPFFLQAFFIPSESMETTLLGHTAEPGKYTDTVNDHIFVNKLIFRYSNPQFKDIIVFRAPKEADAESLRRELPPQENILIKRVIGVPGDTILVKDVVAAKEGERQIQKAVFRNGSRLEEPYIKEPMESSGGGRYGVEQAIKLNEDEYFVMGDNRNNSNDSRFWGIVKRNRVIGKASLIFMPFNRMGLIR
jgi:signal peptidase I